MKALVTGASGFIGSTMVRHLNEAGIAVRALLRNTSSTRNLEGLEFERVEGSLSDISSLAEAVRGVDYVFHFAGVVSALEKKGYLEPNGEGTKRLAAAVAQYNPQIKKFIYVSSLAAGGPSTSRLPREETQAPEPVSIYGESKLLGERHLLQFKDQFPLVIIRPPLVYGPRDTEVFQFVKAVSRNLMPIVTGQAADGKKYYSTIHVDDLCTGILSAAQAESVSSGEIFYLSADVRTYEEILQIIAQKMKKRPLRFPVPSFFVRIGGEVMTCFGKLVGKPQTLNRDKVPEVLADYWVCSNEKAKRLLHFTPRYNFETGMAQALDWYRENHWI